jgi:hypothetical protein
MSLDQAQKFTDGLKDLMDGFRTDAGTYTDTYKGAVVDAANDYAEVYPEVKAAALKFQDASHDYAKEMTDRANQLTTDIQSLYNDVYGGGIDPLVPPFPGIPEEDEGVS